MLNQQLKQGMYLAIVNKVIIIQHQDDIVRHISQFIDEQGSDLIRRQGPRRLGQGGCGLKRIRKGRLQGGGKRVHENGQLVVVFIQGKPGIRAINCLHPLGQQCRLAKAGRGAHQGDLAAECRIQAFDEAGPGMISLPLRGR